LRVSAIELNDQDWARTSKRMNGWAAAVAGVASSLTGTGFEFERTDAVENWQRRQQGAEVASGGDLGVYARNDIVVSASSLRAEGRGTLDAGGDILVVSGVSFEATDSRVSVGLDGKYRKTELEQSRQTLRQSSLRFGGDAVLRSKGDTVLAGSTLDAGGNVTIDNRGRLAILSAEEVSRKLERETEADARVSVGVGNAYNDIRVAIQNYQQARDQRKAAQQALDAFDVELRKLEQAVEAGLAIEDDLRLRREDRKYYEISLALAIANETTAAVQVGQSGARAAAAASSSYGTGFYADLMLELEGSRSEREAEQTASIASRLSANGNLRLSAGTDIHVRGSDVVAGGDLRLAAGNDILIEAGRNRRRSAEDRKSFSAQYSIGTAGVGGWNAAVGAGYDRTDSTTWRNSTLQSGARLRLASGADTAIAGASVSGRKLDLEIGGDLPSCSAPNRWLSAPAAKPASPAR